MTGVVSKVDKPSPWANSIVIVEKRDGSLRLCLDPRDLNRAIQLSIIEFPLQRLLPVALVVRNYFLYCMKKIDFGRSTWMKTARICAPSTHPLAVIVSRDIHLACVQFQRCFRKRMKQLLGILMVLRSYLMIIIIVAAQDEKEHDEIKVKLLERT